MKIVMLIVILLLAVAMPLLMARYVREDEEDDCYCEDPHGKGW